MKKIKIIIITILSFFVYLNTIKADSINSINMEINIDKNGNAIIEEVWNIYVTSGTEGYKDFDKIFLFHYFFLPYNIL